MFAVPQNGLFQRGDDDPGFVDLILIAMRNRDAVADRGRRKRFAVQDRLHIFARDIALADQAVAQKFQQCRFVVDFQMRKDQIRLEQLVAVGVKLSFADLVEDCVADPVVDLLDRSVGQKIIDFHNPRIVKTQFPRRQNQIDILDLFNLKIVNADHLYRMIYITQVAVGKLKELGVFGNDYDTPDGTGVRDYIHVVDLAKGHVKALKKIEDNSGLSIYNLGTGKGYSVLDIVKNFEAATGVKIPYVIKPRRPGDIATCYSDASKAERELGWKAENGIKEMCADSWRWQSNNPNGYEE